MNRVQATSDLSRSGAALVVPRSDASLELSEEVGKKAYKPPELSLLADFGEDTGRSFVLR